MDDAFEEELRRMLDRDQIRQALARYARGIDRYDEELVRSAFHEDAIDCHGPVSAQREDFIATVMPGLREREASQHLLMNQFIDLDGDGAHVETCFMVVRKLPGDDTVEQIGGRYVDRFERRSGEWRIALRVVVAEWQMRGDGSQMAAAVGQFHPGTLGRADVSYERPLQPRDPIGAG